MILNQNAVNEGSQRTGVKVVNNFEQLFHIIETERKSRKSIGFVPTMGSLHEGHLSLINHCNNRCGFSVASIYVNPTQFNNADDLKNYPRNLNTDLRLLSSVDCDCVYAPESSEIYPEGFGDFHSGVDLRDLNHVMEGKFRVGHFEGVAAVVKKLFELVKPDVAFFGEKDFQQLMIIRRLVEVLKLNIEVVGCPIIREINGLAMSSRNELLSADERQNASAIYTTLNWMKNHKSSFSREELIRQATVQINETNHLSVEYLEISSSKDLSPVLPETNGARVFAAVYCGKVRLIDNLSLD